MFFHLNCSNCNHPIDNRESYVHIGLCVTPKLYHLGCYMDSRNTLEGFVEPEADASVETEPEGTFDCKSCETCDQANQQV